MRTGLKKRQKHTEVYFNEESPIVEIYTHNTDLKNRLTAYAKKYPGHCRQFDDDGQGGLRFEIEKADSGSGSPHPTPMNGEQNQAKMQNKTEYTGGNKK